jgi:hypothetical protein
VIKKLFNKMDINNLALKPGPNVYYDQAFRNVLEDHLTYLKTHPTTRTIEIRLNLVFKYIGDFNGLLTELKIPAEMHFICMRMNGMTSPNEYETTMTTLLMPSKEELSRLRSVFKTKNYT